jgi:hypothetical protein
MKMAEKRALQRAGKAKRSYSEETDQIRGLLIRMNYEGLKALRQLALDQDRTLESIGIEAFNDVLRKYGATEPVAEICTGR